MAKILQVQGPVEGKNGKYWKLIVDGYDKGSVIVKSDKYKAGEEITEEIKINDKGDGYFVSGGGDGKKWGGGGGAPRNDELIIAQVAFKGIIDLMAAGQIPTLQKDGTLRADLIQGMGTEMAQAIKEIYSNIKPPAKESKE